MATYHFGFATNLGKPILGFTRLYGDPKYEGEPITCTEATAVLATSDIRSEEMGYVLRTAQGAALSCWFLSHLPKKDKV